MSLTDEQGQRADEMYIIQAFNISKLKILHSAELEVQQHHFELILTPSSNQYHPFASIIQAERHLFHLLFRLSMRGCWSKLYEIIRVGF